jgi:PPK2 family polyphosphate:nucleotide phosphotransferase
VGVPAAPVLNGGLVIWKRYLAKPGRRFRLSDIDPRDTAGFKSRESAQKRLQKGLEALNAHQEKLYAQDRYALLLIFQAMDAAGKDSTIRHVMSGLDPQGCQVFSFKQPSSEELDHDFLWRTNKCLPERGRIGVFNRSYYEEVLIVRVHPNILAGQKLPEEHVTKRIWDERFESIRALEKHLARNGTAIRKFFLHVSKDEQRRRFLERLDRPEKNWKFSLGDVGERAHWKEYQRAYEDAIDNTSTADAPWYVVPADHKWFTRMVVADVIVDALEGLDLRFPTLSGAKKHELKEARKLLEAGK